MTDEARIARLTELARRVWPDALVSSEGLPDYAGVHIYDAAGQARGMRVSINNHPHALDALEAALLVLAGDDEPLSKEQAKDAWSEGFEAARRLFAPQPVEPSDDLERGCIESMKHNAQRMREQCRRERKRAEAAEAKLARLEQLASEWERDAPKFTGPQDVRDVAEYALQQCARELRACVKGEP